MSAHHDIKLSEVERVLGLHDDALKQELELFGKPATGDHNVLQLRLLRVLAGANSQEDEKPRVKEKAPRSPAKRTRATVAKEAAALEQAAAPKKKAKASGTLDSFFGVSKKKKVVVAGAKLELGPVPPPAKEGSLESHIACDEWRTALAPEFGKKYWREIEKFVAGERKKVKVYPPQNEVFAALNITPLSKVRVVILGQDPYFNPNQGHGLCFSVVKGVKVPPSLNRIYKELATDIPKFKIPKHGYLLEWAERGVLLLNATLTVQQKKPNSHKNCGWQTFTNEIINVINKHLTGVVFILWGGFAQKKRSLINSSKHHILAGAHPSPMAGAAWNGCKHFSKANKLLESSGLEPMDWSITL